TQCLRLCSRPPCLGTQHQTAVRSTYQTAQIERFAIVFMHSVRGNRDLTAAIEASIQRALSANALCGWLVMERSQQRRDRIILAAPLDTYRTLASGRQ